MERIADYEIVRPLGAGSNGQFFLAKAPIRLRLNQAEVAVKIVGGAANEDSFRRATRELRLFASIESPYLVTLYDAGQDGGSFYYSMEYFPLGSLRQPGRELDRAAKLWAIADAARAAHALHEAGVVHRAIKPGNIMLDNEGARLSDLGLAQTLTPGMTVTAVGPIGTLEFMDPGILRGERGSRASDIWSLGATLQWSLCGEGLYGVLPENDPLLALRQIMTGEPRIGESLDAREAQLVRSCVASDPRGRPKTAEELAAKLEALARL